MEMQTPVIKPGLTMFSMAWVHILIFDKVYPKATN